MEGAGHEGIVVGSVAEYDELRAAEAVAFGRGLGGLLDDIAHEAHGVHVDARLRGADVDARAYEVGFGERLGDRADQQLIGFRHAFADQSGISAEKVDARSLCRIIEGVAQPHVVLRRLADARADERDRRDG